MAVSFARTRIGSRGSSKEAGQISGDNYSVVAAAGPPSAVENGKLELTSTAATGPGRLMVFGLPIPTPDGSVLGTLEAIRACVWASDAGIRTLGRPVFLRGLSLAGVSATVREALEEADEWDAMSEPAAEASRHRVIECVRDELALHANRYWRASVRRW
jgi:hypothetical protein